MSNRAKGRSKTRVEVGGLGVREHTHMGNVTWITTEMMQRDDCAGLRSLRRREGQLGIRWSWPEPVVVGASASEKREVWECNLQACIIIDLVQRVHTLDKMGSYLCITCTYLWRPTGI